LCDPTLTRKKAYRETHEGVAALGTLDWQAVIGSAVLKCPFLSALLEDMTWAVATRPIDWITMEQTAEPTRLKLGNPGRVLRNIV